ncbi:hypothetical protein [Kribbella monticola]|uniref:hypothetical protein n=1 Tax=Kribbella monticola TaxID=2185285 RepID=UPI000DD3D9AD|nr:hypothetical protein [Kribbella monticola]
MVTQEPHSERSRWLRRAGAAAIATAVLGAGGTGLVVAVLSTQQADGSTGTTASSDDSDSSNSSSDDQGSSSSSGSGLGSTHQGSPTQGGSNGS